MQTKAKLLLCFYFFILVISLISLNLFFNFVINKAGNVINDMQAHKKQTQEIKAKSSIKQTEPKIRQEKQQESSIINIPVNRPVPLSYKTKQEVLDLRKHFVDKSIFKDPNYEPSEEVFGQIEDNKPWVSIKECKYKSTNQADIEGQSEESRFINNPALLVAVDYGFYGSSCEKYLERHIPYPKETPESISYDKSKNEITVVYEELPYCNAKGKTWYILKGLNARDLGYKYGYVDMNKTNFKMHFTEKDNISNSIVEFVDFIHTGGSCGVPGGCNNASPDTPPLNFRHLCGGKNDRLGKNRTIYIKLWKNKPSSPLQEADINEKIIILKSWERRE